MQPTAATVKRRQVWLDAVRATVCFTAALWLVGAVSAALRLRGVDASIVQGVLAGWFLSWLAGAVLGAPLGVIWLVSIGRRSSRQALADGVRGVRQWARDGEPEVHHRRLATLGALVVLIALAAAASVLIGRNLIAGIARPENAALAELLLHLGLLLVAVVLLPFIRAACSLPIRLAARVPGVRWLVTRAGRTALLLLAIALISAVIWIVVQREFVGRFLPWLEVVLVTVALVLAVPLTLLATKIARARPMIRYASLAIWILGLGVTAWVGFRLPLTAGRSRAAMVDESLSGKLGFAVLELVSDFDRDGALAGFTGGDCAPFDRKVHPSAVDVPSNGIDENCDGDDLVLASLTELAGRSNHAVPAAWPKKPPILFVTIDALAARHVRAFGGSRDTAPTIDRLAREGVAFRRCFSQGPSTRLSVPSIFASRYDSEIATDTTGHYPFPILPENLMLAELLAEAGYQTLAVVPNDYFRPTNWKGLTQGFSRVEADAARFWREGYNAQHVTDAAIRQLGTSDGRPLFMWVHYFDPHEPHKQPPDVPVFGSTRRDRYDAKIAWVDRHLTRLIAEARTKLGDDLLIVVSSDHGYAFDEAHAKAGYGYDLSTVVLHVPLVFHARFLKPNQSDLLVSTLDITPTLANLVRSGRAPGFRGFSLVPALSGSSEQRPQIVFHQAYLAEAIGKKKDPLWLVGVRTPRFNMTLDRTTGRLTAFRWQDDYLEENDLWPSQGREEELRALKETLDAFVFAARSNLVK